MMKKLVRPQTQQILIPRLRVADSYFLRLKGLLGTQSLGEDEALWIHRCNSIHTFFMAYPIDCVFLNPDSVVQSVKRNVVPSRIVWPQWGAASVVEMASGVSEKLAIQKGEKLEISPASP